MLKALVSIVWILIIANLFVTLPAVMVGPLNVLGILLLLGHIVEYFLFNQKIKAKGDSTLKSLIMTLLFGVIYIKNL